MNIPDYNMILEGYDKKDHDLELNITSILNYVKNHFLKFILLIIAVLIVFIIEYITNINMKIYSMPSAIIGVNSNNKTVIIKSTKNKKRK